MKDMLAELQDQLKARGLIIRDLLRDRGLIEEQHQARVGRWSVSHDITGSRVCRCLVGSCRHGGMSLLEEALTNIRTLIHIYGDGLRGQEGQRQLYQLCCRRMSCLTSSYAFESRRQAFQLDPSPLPPLPPLPHIQSPVHLGPVSPL